MGENTPPWGKSPIPSSSNQRQIPEWMDPNGAHGPIKFLLLKPAPNSKLPTYPFIISKTVELAAGQIVGGHPCDQGQAYLLKVRSQKQIDKLLSVKQLIDSTPVTVELHPTLNSCKCVVTCREVAGATDEALTKDLANQGVTNVYRFTRKIDGKIQPTNTFVLTIQGTLVPTHIRFGFIQAQTRPYYSRPMTCLQCGILGHTKKHCKNDVTCLNCGEKQSHKDCQKTPHCVNCQGSHPSNSRSCPAFQAEQEIIKIRTDKGISHNEAVKEYRLRQNQTTSVQQRLNQASLNSAINDKNKEISELKQLVAFLTTQIEKLTSQVKNQNQPDPGSHEESDSDTDMTSNSSTVSTISTPKRFWKTSSEDSPTGGDPIKSQTKERPKKKRSRGQKNQALPSTSQTTQPGKTTTPDPSKQFGYNLHTISDPSSRQGAGLAVKINTPYKLLNINTTLNAVCVRVHTPIDITVVSLYIPPQLPYHHFTSEIEHLLSELPPPFIIMGDLNAHSTCWGSSHTTNKGSFLEDLALSRNLTILNNLQPTRIDPASGNMSAIDITLVSWELGPKFGWQIFDDTFGSDHFPILIKLEHPTPKSATRPRWKYDEADWIGYQIEVDKSLALETSLCIPSFTKILLEAGTKNIPRTSGVPGKTAVPWWGPEVRSAIKKRRKALRYLKRIPNDDPRKQQALSEFKTARSLARAVVRTAKANSWQKFTEEVHPNTPTNVLWNKIKILNGEHRSNPFHLLLNQKYINDPSTLANSFCSHFASISSPSNTTMLPLPTNPSLNERIYNTNFSFDELEAALRKVKGLSAGPDDIGYPFLKNLSLTGKTTLLHIFNKIWINGTFPNCWKLGLVIPIVKPKQDPLLLDSYRPITLLACTGKIMERMVNRRLHAILEGQSLLDHRQYAFRSGRSTDDYFQELEMLLDSPSQRNYHTECASLDLSKAFDRVDRVAIINQLNEWGIVGRIMHYITDFLSDRSIQVLVNGTRSEKITVHGGVPQGSVIAPTLFLIAINSIFQKIPPNIQALVYVDDILLISTSAFPKTTRKRLQEALTEIANWAPTVGFQFSPSKSCLLHIGPNRRKLKKLPDLTINNQIIPLTRSTRLLGIWMDDRLNFNLHLNQIRKNAKAKLSILQILANKTSQAHRDSLFRFLHGWFLPSILHGLGLLSRASSEIINKLEPLYNSCIRIIGSAFCTSPISSLMAESGQTPFQYTIAKLLSSKAVRWLSNGGSSEYQMVARTNTLLSNLTGNEIPPICPRPEPRISFWNDKTPTVNLSLMRVIKKNDPPTIIQAHFRQLVEHKFGHLPHAYTDGSKTNNGRVGSGVYNGNNNLSLPIPSQCSVFSSEAFAILKAAETYDPKTVIFSDSASVLSALSHGNIKHPWLPTITKIALQKQITLCWVPGHAGIPGNEAADRLAAAAKLSDPPPIAIPQQDALNFIRRSLQESWDIEWNSNLHAKLREIKNSTVKWTDRPTQNERRALTRLRIGHTRLTHEHLLTKSHPPICPCCDTEITIKHILVTCPQYHLIRQTCRLATNLREILSNCPEEETKVLAFLRKAKLLHKV
ncbi:uncharacterized protein LOC129737559 [Uranotaenia lowii]|uniref:uncharacterized protein LOC129737559 n=1 Tax=Uranotaenia lowii TaxID=190385 RepID=UPI00247B1982|nr:uncharacterized protein LOC129737559 [Uranotaenia lowii]